MKVKTTSEKSSKKSGPSGSEVIATTGPSTTIGKYLSEIGKFDLLTRDQERALARRIKRGDKKAIEEMVHANLRLVVKVANDYDNQGVDLLDLINEGNMGLVEAVKRFDPNNGAKLSTYGVHWIKQRMRRAINNDSKTIRVPVHVYEKVSKIRRVENDYYLKHGRFPTVAYVAKKLKWTATVVQRIKNSFCPVLPLDAPIGDDDCSTFAESVPDDNGTTPYQDFQKKTELALLSQFMDRLSAREQEVLKLRFGLENSDPRTLGDIGKIYGVTRERTRQIQNIAMEKLRRWLASHEAGIPFQKAA